MSYREHRPPPLLAAWVECAWERRDAGAAPARVVPDGCIDLGWTEGAGTRVVGANTTAFLVRLDAGIRVAGVRMRPGGAPALLGVDSEALRDARRPVGEVLGDPGKQLAHEIEEADEPIAALLSGCSGTPGVPRSPMLWSEPPPAACTTRRPAWRRWPASCTSASASCAGGSPSRWATGPSGWRACCG